MMGRPSSCTQPIKKAQAHKSLIYYIVENSLRVVNSDLIWTNFHFEIQKKKYPLSNDQNSHSILHAPTPNPTFPPNRYKYRNPSL